MQQLYRQKYNRMHTSTCESTAMISEAAEPGFRIGYPPIEMVLYSGMAACSPKLSSSPYTDSSRRSDLSFYSLARETLTRRVVVSTHKFVCVCVCVSSECESAKVITSCSALGICTTTPSRDERWWTGLSRVEFQRCKIFMAHGPPARWNHSFAVSTDRRGTDFMLGGAEIALRTEPSR